MRSYDHKKIEKKWQKKWEKSGIYRSEETSGKPKAFVLDMFPYPSGEGLHVGHPKGYIATDIFSRHARMQGKSVLHPMGWDAFGLPAENYAIKNKVHPRKAVEKNVARFKEQLQKIGLDYDWSREINTTDPEYYRWTQWIFLKLFEKGLAYESFEPINWCPSCQTGLANEDLDGNVCERCGTVVEKRPMRQWTLKITDYAERLLKDLDLLPEWQEHIKESQRNWIGKSEGAEIEFAIQGTDEKLKVFTTRPDTLFGATYMVIAPEHPIIHKLESHIENVPELAKYAKEALAKTEIERTAEGKEKTGVKLEGVMAINPANKECIPIYAADYVLAHYGTGAIMAVPAHDFRDHEFATKFNLPIREVVHPLSAVKAGISDISASLQAAPIVMEGILINSSEFDGLPSEEAKVRITAKFGIAQTTYKLRDWVFSRQRYWGEPIPIVHCQKDGVVPVPYDQLPVRLPEVEHYEPTGTGESPLAAIPEWVNTTCPKCGGPAKRETNTMPQWAGSSWYYLRFMDPTNDAALVDPAKEKYWAPVDMYVGGAEHATRHLIYARFWHKFLFDISVVSTPEPFTRLISVGLIMAEDGKKMSKRYGNVINPDDIVETYGADTLRIYEMFMGPFTDAIAWKTSNLIGARRFIERVWRLQESFAESADENVERVLHQTIKKVGEDIRNFKFNTAISAMMIFVNEAEAKSVTKGQYKAFLKLLAPFAPHMADDLWHEIGNETSIHLEKWPKYDPQKILADTVTIAVQVNGKARATVSVPRDSDEETVKKVALEAVARWLEGKEQVRVIFVPNRLINLVLA
ncbi:leucine--tRNA ligase [Candidatus Kaiserbacteria bacterium RIFCSPHIGHO2_01_FULL_56_24]|uniref:Leucine--tRNA ligase n=1 Tax=Candidatus Kaiserbacteria bacterium RIFCSPHIGHO2_01_FULL_56_24 TaxID=1798487 RepID=A0A1F6D8V6_9BACT|nr:MAG: leucine--tRNA ligase [Candidatus Kaiserbacteria bacterium RIFCSPHIGHO2_01_FULL_56_24]